MFCSVQPSVPAAAVPRPAAAVPAVHAVAGVSAFLREQDVLHEPGGMHRAHPAQPRQAPVARTAAGGRPIHSFLLSRREKLLGAFLVFRVLK